jgi:anti-anti-sigma regulatory factor
VSGLRYPPPRTVNQHRRVGARLRSALLRHARIGGSVLRGRSFDRDRDSATGRPCSAARLSSSCATIERSRLAAGTLRISNGRFRDEYIVELCGELTLETGALAEALGKALEDGAERVILDLSRLESIDHSSLHAILLAHLRASDQLKQFVVVPGPSAVQEVFDTIEGPFSYAGE